MIKLLLFINSLAPMIDVEPELIMAVIWEESSWDVDIVNKRTGAAGLMQLLPIAVKEVAQQSKNKRMPQYCREMDPYPATQVDYFTGEWNIGVGSCYLKWLLLELGGDKEAATVAYNCGITRYRKGKCPKGSHLYGRKVMERYFSYKKGIEDVREH